MREILYDWGEYNSLIFTQLNKLLNANVNIAKALKYLSIALDIEKFALYYFILVAVLIYKYSRSIVELHEERFVRYYSLLMHLGICYASLGFIAAALKFGVNMPRPYCSLPVGEYISIIEKC